LRAANFTAPRAASQRQRRNRIKPVLGRVGGALQPAEHIVDLDLGEDLHFPLFDPWRLGFLVERDDADQAQPLGAHKPAMQ
jgi:hypothetical protein